MQLRLVLKLASGPFKIQKLTNTNIEKPEARTLGFFIL